VIPTIAITMGDPGGIGPEVIVKALSDATLRGKARFIVLGLGSSLARAARKAGLEPYWEAAGPFGRWDPTPGVMLLDDELGPRAEPYPPFAHEDSELGGKLSLDWVQRAIEMARAEDGEYPQAQAIVTAPISKTSWSLAGETRHPGHTGLIASRLGVTKYAMMFASPLLNVILVTDHIPLKLVSMAIRPEAVRDTIELGHAGMQRLGVAKPRIAVCGLNPHAGEGGMLGDEDGRHVQPGVEQARTKEINVQGPFPADTVFRRARRGEGFTPEFDLVVAMYHDQGLIPVKLLDRDRAVNVTVGLPIVRTSPDHGTAFDIAGQNRADPGSMKAAIELAIRMSAKD
jgi:4-hydroxythreonine-4-phosphate dehydrogenase